MKCNKCSQEAAPGKKRCPECIERDQNWTKKRRAYRLANNLCLRCGQNPPDSERYCRPCLTKFKLWRNTDKQDAIEHYGGICACCGESNQAFLTIDHINGGGTQHRKKNKNGSIVGNSVYRWLRKQGYPDGHQVLCFNCNCAKGLYGQCPHQTLAVQQSIT